ncbi:MULTISPECIES: hypothetical protein [Bradyrhizobium]|uniref:hypothetical protein n=1 Tax=Bradyrhizobium TaxID=374 RepID=UPI00155F0845|nr:MULTISPECIES: hypothetical protein [Bradyrhizobium]MDD1521589.1 hypothetical protein [Bradyrhizobium sp. WBAH30]MDD1545641.1 hypothetical protein [Bradyrhizobium sp. WBAH41]MDD1554029.1 hypothetical protein [Bradyrhizobium sp. WBAH23]MDD1561981.1 hypothetical protein [Bradyrhizobium sp. WBAH33]MDD1591515.1 hypothetical protein [Bradyrhizobium sp. WBAH42]
MNRLTSIGLAVLMTCIGLNSADAQSLGSSYTSTAAKDCRQVGKPSALDGSSTRVCPGKDGLIVLIAEDDLREIVSVGRNRKAAAEEPAAKVWFAPFNSSEPTIEWRAAGAKPFAIIQRWHIADNSDPDKQGRPNTKAMLVVTRLPPGPVCHVAYVDAIANPNANELARKAADDLARGFACGKDEVKIIGTPGRAVELATRR